LCRKAVRASAGCRICLITGLE